MKKFTKYFVIALLGLYVSNVTAQETNEVLANSKKEEQIILLKDKIRAHEKDALKIEVEKINDRVIKKK